MPVLYFDVDKNSFFSAPQFNIMNHRYRGTRESIKINLEINQLTYSFHSLYARYNTLLDKFASRGTTLLEGNEEEVSPLIEVTGLENLASRCDALAKRLEALEA